MNNPCLSRGCCQMEMTNSIKIVKFMGEERGGPLQFQNSKIVVSFCYCKQIPINVRVMETYFEHNVLKNRVVLFFLLHHSFISFSSLVWLQFTKTADQQKHQQNFHCMAGKMKRSSTCLNLLLSLFVNKSTVQRKSCL